MNVLSLFDGISCARVAFDRAQITIDKYYASEISEQAIRVSSMNYPDIVHIGDVKDIDFNTYSGIDIVVGGSPCSWWSNARTANHCKDTRERTIDGNGYELFQYYVQAVRQTKCRYFIYENNYSMSKEVMNQISTDLGVQPIMIDSALVSAQSRKRYYWTNIQVDIPADRHIMLSDIIEDAVTGAAIRNQKTKDGYDHRTDIRKDGKSNCLVTFATKRNNCIQLKDNSIRPLTADEFELLQTLPIGYTKCLSESGRKSVCALGWTVDVIAYIMKHMPESALYEPLIVNKKLF